VQKKYFLFVIASLLVYYAADVPWQDKIIMLVFPSFRGDIKLPRPAVMGILNVTPDSFSDGGRYASVESALQQAVSMIKQGAAILDIGGESTRPGAQPVGIDEELSRVIPVIEAIRRESEIPLSIDTSKPVVMQEAVAAGADMINDVYALREEGAVDMVAQLDVPVCLMHMKGEPRTMQQSPQYEDVVKEVVDFLQGRVASCLAAKIKRAQLMIDPGFGFGKTVEHNLGLVKHLAGLKALGLPVLLGFSRKSTIGAILDKGIEARQSGGVALATLAVWWGADVIRTHDVAATSDVVKICEAMARVP